MVAGHLSEKKGYFYAVLTYYDSNGKRKFKWIPTSLPVKGNKKKAEAFLQEARCNFKPETNKLLGDDILFADYMEQWLEIVKSTISISTYSSYSECVKKIIAPYFRERNIMLRELQAKDIQNFYLHELKRVSANSVIHYHANIHKALKYAVKIDLIGVNPADKVERPKKDKFVGSYYDADEVNHLFEIAQGTKLEIPVLFGAFYGLRRSEVIGLKWSAIDFERNTLTIQHTVVQCNIDGKRELIDANPFDRVDRPKKNKFQGENYSEEELLALLKLTKDDPIYPAIMLAGGLGLRRSEALGVRWSRINFEERYILLDTKIVESKDDSGKFIRVVEVEEMKIFGNTGSLIAS